MTNNQIETAATIAEQAWDNETITTTEYLRELVRLATYGDPDGQITRRAANVGSWADANKRMMDRLMYLSVS